MTKTQTQIIDLIARLPVGERREVVEHIRSSGLLEDSLYDRMTPEQAAHLAEGVAEADRGEGEPAAQVLDRIAERHRIPRA